jgi:hypothetical protein
MAIAAKINTSTTLADLISKLLQGGSTLADAVIPRTRPERAEQLDHNCAPPLCVSWVPQPAHLARVVGWKEGEKPTVADGLKIEALATGLQGPSWSPANR